MAKPRALEELRKTAQQKAEAQIEEETKETEVRAKELETVMQWELLRQLQASEMVASSVALTAGLKAEAKKLATNLVHTRVVKSNREVNLSKAKEVQNVASFCQVQTPKKGFVNTALFRSQDNELLLQAFDRVFTKIGVRQWDAPSPRLVNKDIRKWVGDQRDKM